MLTVALKFIVLILLLNVIEAQNECSCMDEESDAQWGDFVSMGNCMGSCQNWRRTVRRRCVISESGTTVECSYEENCTNTEVCPKWTSWDNEGPCKSTCQGGIQLQKRICYENRSNSFYRSRLCPGSQGQTEQAQNVTCPKKLNCEVSSTLKKLASTIVATTNSSTATTPSTTIATRPATSAASKSMATTIARLKTTTRSAVPATAKATTRVISSTTSGDIGNFINVSNYSNLTLPLVLCSVALICIAVIISFVIIFKRNPHDQTRNHEQRRNKDNNNETKKEMSHNYEDVGPALPPMRRTESKPALANNEISLTVKNELYATGKALTKDSTTHGNNEECPTSLKESLNKIDPVQTTADQTTKEKMKSNDNNFAKNFSLENQPRKSRTNKYTASKKLLKSKPTKVKPKKMDETTDDYVKLTDLPMMNVKNPKCHQQSQLLQSSETRNSYCNDASISLASNNETISPSPSKNNEFLKYQLELNYVTMDQLENKTLIV